MADIDSLKFSIILDSDKFEKGMKRVEGMAKDFEKSVQEAINTTRILELAQKGLENTTKGKAKAQKEVVLLSRQELEAKKAAGTITKSELQQLRQIIAADKAVLEEQNKQLTAMKKQLDIQDKQERMARRREAAERDTGEAVTLTTGQLIRQNSVMSGLTSMIAQYASVFGAASIVRNMVRITGEFEAQHAALRAILQDTAAADEIFSQLQVLAVRSPYTFQNLTAYAKQLTAFSVPVNEVYETTRKLADVSAGLGVDMGRIILAYGQVRSAEFLRGQEVRQFTEAGIPILKELAEQFQEIEGRAISVGEVFNRISARQVPFEMVEEAFNRMTSAGGKFYNMQEVLAETVKGKISNLQDAWEIMLSRIGDEHSGTIKGIITWITNLLSNYERWLGLLGGIIAYIGAYNAAMLTMNTITRASNGLMAIKNGLDLVQKANLSALNILLPTNNALEKISIANKKEEAAVLATLNMARKAAAGVLSALVAVMVYAISRYKNMREEASKTADAINSALGKLSATMAEFDIATGKVEDAFRKMKEAEGDATAETKEFNKSVDDLKKQFPKFIDDHIKMAESVDELKNAWVRARLEMNQYYADEASEKLNNDLKRNRNDETDKIEKDFTKWIVGLFKDEDVGAGYASLAFQYVTGNLSHEQGYDLATKIGGFFNEKQGNSINYARSIMKDFEKYAAEYKAAMDRYKEARKAGEDAIKANGLSTTRNTVNDLLFGLDGAKTSWNLQNGQSVPFAGLSEEQKKAAREWWDSNNDLAMQMGEDIDKWAERQRSRLASGKISERVASVIRAAFNELGQAIDDTGFAPWQNDLNKIIEKFHGTAIKPTDDLYDLIDKWIKELNDIDEKLKKFPKDYANMENESYKSLVGRRNMLWALSEGLYGTGVKDFSGNTKSAKRDAKDVVAALKQDYQDLKEIKTWYDKLKDLKVDDKRINDFLIEFFGRGIPAGGFKHAFEGIALKLDNAGEKNTARDVRNYANGRDANTAYEKLNDDAKAAEKAKKALEKYLEALEKWTNKEKALEGTGVAYKLNKAIADYRKGMADAQSKYDKVTSMPGANKVGNIQALLNLGRDQNGFLAKLKNNLSGLVDEIVKEGLKTQGMDLSDLAHKNLSQILKIKDAVGKIELPKSTRDAIKALGPEGDDLLKNLEDSLKQFVAALTENELDPKIMDKIGKGAKFTASQIRKLAGSFGELADATNNADLKGVAESIESIGNFASSVAEGYKQGNVYGAIVSAVAWMAQQVIGGVTAMEKANAEFQKKTEAAAIAYKNAINSAKVDSNDTIFGSDTIGRMTELLRIARESAEELEKFRMAFRTRDGIDIFAGLGYSKENGEIDIEKLLSDIENGLLSGLGADRIKDWINDYKESLKGLDDIVESVFGSIAESAADKIVNSWIEAGDAALNYIDILDDVAKAYSKMLVQSMIMETFLDPITDDLKKAFYENRYGDAMAMIANAMDGIANSAPQFEQILSAFDPYFNLGGGSGDSIGNGIKSITEETASLLASYFNAVRADVSVMRVMEEKGWSDVASISGYFPTLNDYLQQIAANTYNNAQNTARILSEIQSVIGAPGTSGNVVRVENN